MKIFWIIFLLKSTLVSGILNHSLILDVVKKSIPTHIKKNNRVLVEKMYENRSDELFWIGEANKERTASLIQALHNPFFNYKSISLNQKSIKRLFYLIDTHQIKEKNLIVVYARLELLLSDALIRLIEFIVQGDVDWDLVQKKLHTLNEKHDISCVWEMKKKVFPKIERIEKNIEDNNLTEYLKSLIPMEKRYDSLIKMLQKYQKMQKFPQLKHYKKVLTIGQSAKRIKAIKRRLQISGDYPKEAPLDEKFDATLKSAILHYQKRYHLKETGVIDTHLTFYLNKPLANKIETILINLDKTKLYPKAFEAEYIEVNLPEFALRYYAFDYMVKKMGLVIGRLDRPTPIFSHALTYMILNPTWTIPDNLIKRDLIPVLKQDASYLQKHNIHVYQHHKEMNVTSLMLSPYEDNQTKVPYRFVQLSGEDNALGKVKFMFPNRYAVYLHDTNNKSLLEHRYKLFSSGCMRVEKPFELVDTLLLHSTKSYTEEEIEDILATNKPHTIKFKRAIPIHIVYFTAYEENGIAYFSNDIYLYDKIIHESTAKNRQEDFEIPSNRLKFMPRDKKEPMNQF